MNIMSKDTSISFISIKPVKTESMILLLSSQIKEQQNTHSAFSARHVNTDLLSLSPFIPATALQKRFIQKVLSYKISRHLLGCI